MFNVPSVTMNAGSRTNVTRLPFSTPKATQTRSPRAIARKGEAPFSITAFVITICPSAITVPTERSIPAVRITTVWPIARTPTTITCWSTSERFWASRKRSDLNEKKAIASSSARKGPTVGSLSTRSAGWSAPRCPFASSAEVVSLVVTIGAEGLA